MSILSLYIVTLLTLYTTPSIASLRRNNAADNKVQQRNFVRRLQVVSSLSEDNYLLELIVDSPMDSKSDLEETLCKSMGEPLPVTDYLEMVVNESGRKFVEEEATRKQIPVENVVWFADFSNRRQLENEKEASLTNEVDTRELQTGFVWKFKVVCNLCSVDDGDGRMLSYQNTIGDAVADAVQRRIQSDCNMTNLEAVVFDKLDI
jgi:hypothetical protein